MDKPTRICTVAGCENKYRARGYCNKHYLRWQNHGDPLGGNPGPSVRKVVDFPDSTRQCTGCGRRQNLDQFDLDKNASLGRKSKCKACRSEQMSALYRKDPETRRAYMRKRLVDNPEHVRALDTERYQRDRDKRIEVAEKSMHIRRAKAAGVPFENDITRASLRCRFGDLCCYCGVELDFDRVRGGVYPSNLATIEHVIPLNAGGAHDWDNVRLACHNCNMSKGGKSVEEWRGSG